MAFESLPISMLIFGVCYMFVIPDLASGNNDRLFPEKYRVKDHLFYTY